MQTVETVLARTRRNRSGCLVWQGHLNNRGYAHTTINGKNVLVHRWIYEQQVGKIPKGFTIDHVKKRGCRSRACLNVLHMEAVTGAENTRRALVRTHCKNGHKFTKTNTYVRKEGQKMCRTCMRASTNRWRSRQREMAA